MNQHPYGPPVKPRKWHRQPALWVAVAGAALLWGGVAGASGASTEPTEAAEPTTTEGRSGDVSEYRDEDAPEPAPTTEEPTTTTEEPELAEPVAADYAIELVTESKQCFGSAGCNVTVVPELSMVGPAAILWEGSASVTYQIDGDESGPVIGTLDVDSDGMYQVRQTFLSTSSEGVVPTVTITDVRPSDF